MKDTTAKYIGPWGHLYSLDAKLTHKMFSIENSMYNNDRPPHVSNGPAENIVVMLSQAYVKQLLRR